MKYAIINIEVLEKRIEELEEMSKHNQQVGEYDSEGEIISEIKEILSNTIPLEQELEKAYDKGIIWNSPDQCIIEEKVSKKEYIQNLKLSI